MKEFSEISKHPLMNGDDYSNTPYIFFGVIYEILKEKCIEEKDTAKQIILWFNNILNNPETNKYIEDMLWIELFEGSEFDNTYRDFLLFTF